MYDRDLKRIVVDAGHGGSDPGAVANGLLEKDLNLKAAQYMYKRLQDLNIPVTIVRNEDETLDREERINRIINAYGNSSDVILISNHINAGGGEGAEVVYALRNTPELANLILENIGEAGQVKRKVYQRRLPENPNKDYYFIIRDTGNIESLLVEYGFIDNIRDASKLENNLTDYVEGVVKALTEYLNVPYIKPTLEDNYYIVKKGDTLYSIANKFSTTVSELKQLNNLQDNTLQIGQQLIISAPENNLKNTYIVQKGDTLYSIASAYGISVQELKELNSLKTNNLYIGQILNVPSQDINIPSTDIIIPESYIIYTVEKGDSLWSISRKFDITIPEILELNNLTSINLKIGDQLKIPSSIESDTSKKTYIVKKGDTLWSIARENNISISELKDANNLETNLLSIGQQLIIP